MRKILLAGSVLVALAVGCSSSSDDAPDPNLVGTPDAGETNDGGDPGLPPLTDTSPAEWNRAVTPPSDADAKAQREGCGYLAGALPLETQGASLPDGSKIPIDTIVIIMMENRSFDHYFQDLPNAGQPDVEVAPAGASNLGVDNTTIPFAQDTRFCFADTNHEWTGVHEQINHGAMDGFAKSNEGAHESPVVGDPTFLSGARAMVHYTKQDLPFMYWAADNFAIADHYFASVPGPTWPNRMYLMAASSFGKTSNTFPGDQTTIFDQLLTRGVQWKLYAAGGTQMAIFPQKILPFKKRIVTYDKLANDAAAGTLPPVVFLDPALTSEGYDGNDEHPPAVMQIGQNWLANTLKTLSSSPQWAHMAVFLNYDEHGGLYDHVPPPKACAPDNLLPDDPSLGVFDELGVRVPFVVFSPYAKKHYVSHEVYDHTSVTRFVEARHRLPAMTNRDANALVPWDMFDFNAAPNLTPPVIPNVPVDDAKVAACGAVFENLPE